MSGRYSSIVASRRRVRRMSILARGSAWKATRDRDARMATSTLIYGEVSIWGESLDVLRGTTRTGGNDCDEN